MNLVSFRHRRELPVEPQDIGPVVGTFYWIDNGGDTQLWFAYGNTWNDMILLNDKFDMSNLTSKISEIENSLAGIEERLDEIDLTPYITNTVLNDRLESLKEEILSEIGESDFDDFVRREELEQYLPRDEYHPYVVDLGDSDYDEIAERVKLTWQII